jgi:N-acetylglucosaminyldiphosphoundecaprenol N-acetyl-beta-D-mannosaminyltransferase
MRRLRGRKLRCAAQDFRPYFLGSEPIVLERAMDNAEARWPGLTFAGHHHGLFSAHEEAGLVEMIRRTGADCLFIGMPTPRKERFLNRYRDVLGVPFVMGVGGAFDVLAGSVARAPELIQRTGLEWLYCAFQEPRRMRWRYARANFVFAGMLARALLGRALRGGTLLGRI